MEHGTTLLLGLEGLAVEQVEEAGDGTRVVHVTTADATAAACPDCGVFSISGKGRRVTRPKDLPYGERGISIRWHKRRWRCRESACSRGSFTEAIPQVPARARCTTRLREAMGAAVGEANRDVAEVADAHGVSWPTAHRAFAAHADAELAEPEPTKALGIDETRRGRPRWDRNAETGRWERLDRWHTGFVDLAGRQGLLGQVVGRRGADVVTWLEQRSEAFRAGVEFVAIDPCAAYAAGVRKALPHATLVVDHFHLVKLANDAVTAARRRVTWENRDRRGRAVDPEWANRRRLLTAKERLSDKGFARMWNACMDGDPSGQILAAWIAKEQLRTLLAAAKEHAERPEIARRLYAFYDWCATVDVPEVTTLAETIDTWWDGIEAFLRTGITNAGTEGYNRLVKDVTRRGCGFRNPENHRRRIRYVCTRQSRRTPEPDSHVPPQS